MPPRVARAVVTASAPLPIDDERCVTNMPTRSRGPRRVTVPFVEMPRVSVLPWLTSIPAFTVPCHVEEDDGCDAPAAPSRTPAGTAVAGVTLDTAVHGIVTRPARSVSMMSSADEVLAMCPVKPSPFVSATWSARAGAAGISNRAHIST
jgi:hypothetical protein